jgi:endonuclease/exonuclease/phosphatase (EEP) superfamily protein YafD
MKKLTIRLLKTIATSSLLISLYLLCSQTGWITTLLISTSMQICIGCMFIAVSLFYFRIKKFAIISLIASFIFSTNFMGNYKNDSNNTVEFEITTPKLKVAHFNVLKFNSSKQQTIETIINSDADIVSLQETDELWTKEIESAVKKDYPYCIFFPSDICCFGISLLSKQPLYNSNISFHGGIPNIEADLIFNDVVTHVISSHTASPISRSHLVRRNTHLSELSDHVAKIDSPTIVIGDFNTVPWDKKLVNFKAETQLKDSRKAYESTFPSYFGNLGIPIDYIFHSKEISCLSFKTIAIAGSDHLGIIGEYAMN